MYMGLYINNNIEWKHITTLYLNDWSVEDDGKKLKLSAKDFLNIVSNNGFKCCDFTVQEFNELVDALMFQSGITSMKNIKANTVNNIIKRSNSSIDTREVLKQTLIANQTNVRNSINGGLYFFNIDYNSKPTELISETILKSPDIKLIKDVRNINVYEYSYSVLRKNSTGDC